MHEEGHLLRWCPDGLSRSQKRRVHRLRSLEQAKKNYLRLLKQVNSGPAAIPPPRRTCNMVWRRVQPATNISASADPAAGGIGAPSGKRRADSSADINMVFFLPEEFRSPQPSQEIVAQLNLGPAAIVFEKPIDKKYRHLKPMYLKGYINGKPVNRMLVDTGVAVNLLSYGVCRKIGRTEEDLVKTNVVLNDFKGSPTPTKGVLLRCGLRRVVLGPAWPRLD